jgi:hypothetical protein
VSQRVLIVGVSESGKSSLALKLMQGAGIPFYVRDPFLSDWPGATLITADMEEFKAKVLADVNPRIALIDEGGDVLTVGDKENHQVFTQWRHHAILPIVIAQRMNMIAPNVRTSSTDLYLFESSLADCEILARDKNCDELLGAADFEAGDFFHLRKVDGKKTLTQHRLW